MRKNQYENWNAEGLRSLLLDSGLTDEDFAKAIGVSESSVRNYIEGKNVPEAGVLVKIADFFAVSCDFLLGRVTEEEEKEIRENYSERFMLLRRAPYEWYLAGRMKFKERYDKEKYESPWPYNLLDAVFDNPMFAGWVWEDVISVDQYDGLMDALETVPVRSKEMLLEYFKEGKRLLDIGDEKDLSRERVRQILSKGLRVLRNPVNVKLIKFGHLGAQRDREVNKKMLELDRLERELENKEKELREVRVAVDNAKDVSGLVFGEVTLAGMFLTTRSENILRRMGARTLKDVVGIVEEGNINKRRGVGKKVLEEILDKVEILTGVSYRELYARTLIKYGVNV